MGGWRGQGRGVRGRNHRSRPGHAARTAAHTSESLQRPETWTGSSSWLSTFPPSRSRRSRHRGGLGLATQPPNPKAGPPSRSRRRTRRRSGTDLCCCQNGLLPPPSRPRCRHTQASRLRASAEIGGRGRGPAVPRLTQGAARAAQGEPGGGWRGPPSQLRLPAGGGSGAADGRATGQSDRLDDCGPTHCGRRRGQRDVLADGGQRGETGTACGVRAAGWAERHHPRLQLPEVRGHPRPQEQERQRRRRSRCALLPRLPSLPPPPAAFPGKARGADPRGRGRSRQGTA